MLELRSGDVTVAVDPPSGGLVTGITVGATELLTPAGLFVMAPWAGRTALARFGEHRLPVDQPPHAIHGTVRGIAWTVDDVTTSTVTLSTSLGPAWPWPGRCQHVVAVHDDHVTLRVAVDGAGFPAVVGWHPWFVKPVAVELEAEAMLERGDDHLPTGQRVPPVRPGDRPLDDCFEGVRWPAVLQFEGGLEVRLHAEGCRWAVVFDELPTTTCVEPQTGPPNALNDGSAPPAPIEAALRIGWT